MRHLGAETYQPSVNGPETMPTPRALGLDPALTRFPGYGGGVIIL
jgi:hypothetical protein